MWFRLILADLCAPLAALVGSDGYLYWRVLDLAQLLGRRNVYQFAKTVVDGSVRGRDVLVFPPLAATETTLRSQLVDTHRAYRLLLKKNPPLARAFEHALLAGRARVTMPAVAGLSHKVAPTLTVVVDDDDGVVDIPSWINEYTGAALQIFAMMTAGQADVGGAATAAAGREEDTQPLPEPRAQEANAWIPEGLDEAGVYQSHLRPTSIFDSRVNRGEWVIRVHDTDRELPSTVFVLCGNRMQRYVQCPEQQPPAAEE